MAATFVAIAVIGFTPTYWAPMARGTLSVSPLVHLHAARAIEYYPCVGECNRVADRDEPVTSSTSGSRLVVVEFSWVYSADARHGSEVPRGGVSARAPPQLESGRIAMGQLIKIFIISLTIIASANLSGQTPRQRDEPGKPLTPQPQRVLDPDNFVMPYQSNFTGKEDLTTTRGKDGRCDWGRVRPKRKLEPNAENWFFGEKHERTCTGVAYFTFIPPEYRVGAPPRKPEPGVKSDTTVAVAPSVWEGRDTTAGRGRQARDVVNALQRRLTSAESVTGVTFQSGDTTAEVQTMLSPTRWRVYSLRRRNGGWVVISGVDSPIR
jgi:hypothetical protein